MTNHTFRPHPYPKPDRETLYCATCGHSEDSHAMTTRTDIDRARRYIAGGKRINAKLMPETANVAALLDELTAARAVVAAAKIAAESLGSHCLEWEDHVSELIGIGHSERAPGRNAEAKLRATLNDYDEITTPND